MLVQELENDVAQFVRVGCLALIDMQNHSEQVSAAMTRCATYCINSDQVSHATKPDGFFGPKPAKSHWSCVQLLLILRYMLELNSACARAARA